MKCPAFGRDRRFTFPRLPGHTERRGRLFLTETPRFPWRTFRIFLISPPTCREKPAVSPCPPRQDPEALPTGEDSGGGSAGPGNHRCGLPPHAVHRPTGRPLQRQRRLSPGPTAQSRLPANRGTVIGPHLVPRRPGGRSRRPSIPPLPAAGAVAVEVVAGRTRPVAVTAVQVRRPVPGLRPAQLGCSDRRGSRQQRKTYAGSAPAPALRWAMGRPVAYVLRVRAGDIASTPRTTLPVRGRTRSTAGEQHSGPHHCHRPGWETGGPPPVVRAARNRGGSAAVARPSTTAVVTSELPPTTSPPSTSRMPTIR